MQGEKGGQLLEDIEHCCILHSRARVIKVLGKWYNFNRFHSDWCKGSKICCTPKLFVALFLIFGVYGNYSVSITSSSIFLQNSDDSGPDHNYYLSTISPAASYN